MSKEFICKGCGEKFNKDMQSNNVGYCYICNEFYMQKQISDLESKLAESEEQINMLEEHKFYADNIIQSYADKSKNYEQQLAEKDEQLNSAQVGEEFALKCCDEANKLLALQVAGQHQDKISFAVEQIIKIREKIDNSEKIGIGLTLDGIYELDNIFNNKLAELTHNHEYKVGEV